MQTGSGFSAYSPASFILEGNGTHIADAVLPDVFDPLVPVDFILTPGAYRIEIQISANFVEGAPSALAPAGFVEFGGITDFEGFAVELTGTRFRSRRRR